ncbi:acetyl-CoA carboxylase carboxyltransferase subunit alpha [Ostreibacterium oceani]|uniref:Acetyl-coenzyme A carboxylase carboxyl transferase subunit alpha n=1 Tax=Ostreibacterium oceani TaxID=2654998 RepID=A0A6N7F0J8_9GAMM|nr:acetyl-CoA carboxylase carboxyltransferase subunit alpha [Ostreibacterium oceani]MPV85376.1 acetyl-CoA carboxylase carboxyltransferase subunit alpha [Ostreibacterium oceani]
MQTDEYIDIEQPIVELQEKIHELKKLSENSDIDIGIEDEMQRLEKKSQALTKEIFSKLTPWQTAKLARHPLRPYALDYIEKIFTSFNEIHGDRTFADDKAIVCGIAMLEQQPVMVIGQHKGRSTKEKVYRNFGMPRPEGYRKAKRAMHLAEKFSLPIITFIDTPGAYPGIGAEERGQSEAIAANLYTMASLKVPIICTVIGEGGSGGALAIGVGDRVFMLENSIYSVISPEGCASILWRSAEHAKDAADAMHITAKKLQVLDLIDDIIPEPLGGAHRDIDETAAAIKKTITSALADISAMDTDSMLEKRYTRIRQFGFFDT